VDTTIINTVQEPVQQAVTVVQVVAQAIVVEVTVMYHKPAIRLVTVIALVAVLVDKLRLAPDAHSVHGQDGRLYQVAVHPHLDVAMEQHSENVKLALKNVFVRKYRRQYDTKILCRVDTG
jgi:hypothetical protein